MSTKKKSSKKARATKKKARNLRLAAYSLAAGASPMIAANADAAPVPFNVGLSVPFDGSSNQIDVNGDGTNDLDVQNRSIGIYNGSWQVIYTTDSGSTDFPDGLRITDESYTVPGVGDFSYITPQSPGQLIDGSGMFSYFANVTYGGLGPAIGDLNAGDVLLGFELGIAGQKHFGWIRINLDLSGATPVYQVLDGAYESDPETPIAAGAGAIPEPMSLGLLATGAAGLGLYRRRRVNEC